MKLCSRLLNIDSQEYWRIAAIMRLVCNLWSDVCSQICTEVWLLLFSFCLEMYQLWIISYRCMWMVLLFHQSLFFTTVISISSQSFDFLPFFTPFFDPAIQNNIKNFPFIHCCEKHREVISTDTFFPYLAQMSLN